LKRGGAEKRGPAFFLGAHNNTDGKKKRERKATTLAEKKTGESDHRLILRSTDRHKNTGVER